MSERRRSRILPTSQAPRQPVDGSLASLHGTSAHPFHSDQKCVSYASVLPAQPASWSVRRRRGRHRRRRADRRGRARDGDRLLGLHDQLRPGHDRSWRGHPGVHRRRLGPRVLPRDRVDQRCRQRAAAARQHLVRPHPLRGPRGPGHRRQPGGPGEDGPRLPHLLRRAEPPTRRAGAGVPRRADLAAAGLQARRPRSSQQPRRSRPSSRSPPLPACHSRRAVRRSR